MLKSFFGLIVLVITATGIARSQNTPPPIQNFKDVEAIVQAHFRSIPDFREGDLVTRSMVQKLFERLRQFSWDVPDQDKLVERTLPDGDFLVKTFKSEKGRAFLKTIRRYKEGIDRVDRLSRMPQGKANVHALVYKVPNGTDWIKSMTSESNGRDLSNSLARTPSGKDFNKPTGRLYFVEDVLKQLKESFDKTQTRTIRNRTR